MQHQPRFIADGAGLPPHPPQGPESDDSEALDAYSRSIVTVSEQLRPAVVHLEARKGRRGGSGSGVRYTPDGLLLTNHHVVQSTERAAAHLTDGGELPGRV